MIRHTISMPDSMSEHVIKLVSDSHYSGVSDYLRDLVRQDLVRREALEKEESILELKQLIAEADASGIGEKSMNQIRKEARKKLGI